MADIRVMRESDLEAVRDVDSEAFFAWATQVYGDEVTRHRRMHDNVQACLQRDPQGCFVATENGGVVGFVFSRTWGGVGWFGTFAVLPDWQRRGIGKQLIAASLAYLQQESGRVIGLETMAASPSNLGLYLRLGFDVRWPTLVLGRSVPAHAPFEGDVRRWSAADAATQQRWLGELRAATGRIMPGLDYAKEVQIHEAFRHGETLVLCNGGVAVGLSVLRWVSGAEADDDPEAKVQVLALDPQHTDADRLGVLLRATEALAAAAGRLTLTLPVNGQHSWTVRQLLQQGYRVERTAVRMVLPDSESSLPLENAVDCSRWAG